MTQKVVDSAPIDSGEQIALIHILASENQTQRARGALNALAESDHGVESDVSHGELRALTGMR